MLVALTSQNRGIMLRTLVFGIRSFVLVSVSFYISIELVTKKNRYICVNTLLISQVMIDLNPFNRIQTGLFWSICDCVWGGGGAPRTPPSVFLEPIMLESWHLHTMIISIQRSPTPSFDLTRPMMTSQ